MSRCRFVVSDSMTATSSGRAPTTRAIGARSWSSMCIQGAQSASSNSRKCPYTPFCAHVARYEEM